MSAAPDLFTQPAAEDWLAWRLEQLGHPTDPDRSVALKDRIRAAITTAGIGMVIAGRSPVTGAAESLEAAWERIYRESFAPKAPRSRSPQRKATP